MFKRSDEFPDLLYRDCQIEPPKKDADRTIELSFSSEKPYLREFFFQDPWIEVLGHKSDEIDLSRLKNSASVHYNHSRLRADRIGSVIDAWVENGTGRAKIQLSNRKDIEDIWGDVRDGLLRNASVGYKVHKRVLVKENADGPDEYRMTKWEPLEISLVDIPADASVGIGRDLTLGTARPRGMSSAAPHLTLTRGDDMTGRTKDASAIAEGRRLESERVIEINQSFQFQIDTPEMRVLQMRCLNDPECSIDVARKLLLDEIGKHKSASGMGHFQPGEVHYDGISSSRFAGPADFGTVVVDALLLRCGSKLENVSLHVDDVRGLSLVDIAKACLEQNGVNTRGYSASKMVSRSMTTSDFPNILANLGEKLVLEGFENPERGTHRIWTKEAVHRDFKPTSSVAASETPSLSLVGEGGEFTHGVLEETGDTVSLATYGKILSLSRQAIVNDDLHLLEAAARNFGDSAIRLEADICYAVLTTNPTMHDGTVLFDASHNNVGTGAALSVTSLGEARNLMRQQMGLNNESFLDPQPFALITPTAIETAAEQLLSSIWDPAGSIQATTTPEFIRRLQLVADPRLDSDSTTQWYVVANPDAFTWVKRIYLDGQIVPFIEEKSGFEIDAWQIKIRHDFAAKAFEWQGAVRNAGA